MTTIDGRHVVFQGEMQMMRWAESSTTGATVTMWIHPEDLESFKLLRARAGKHPGQRLGVVMVQIGDDEAVIEHEETPAAPPPAPTSSPAPSTAPTPRATTYRKPAIGDMGLCAVLWCKMPAFRQWASEKSGVPVVTEADAKEFVLIEAEVVDRHSDSASRKWLDTDPECGRAFLNHVYHPWVQYARENGISLGKDDR